MKCLCPGCNTANHVPNVWAGRSIACRKCETQVTVPERAASRPRSWLHSPGWVAVALVEILCIVGIVAMALALTRGRPPQDLPLVPHASEGPPQLAVLGQPLLLEWDTDIESAGGHFRIRREHVALVREDGRDYELKVRAAQKPWPPTLPEADPPPPPVPVRMSLEVDLPASPGLAGQAATVRATLFLDYPTPARLGGPITIRRAAVRHEHPLRVATDAERARLRFFLFSRGLMRAGIVLCAVAFVAVGVGAVALARKEITVICPHCGRATDAYYYHERGIIYLSDCPHKRAYGRHPSNGRA